jgi:Ni/Co efflux regulator RcnB
MSIRLLLAAVAVTAVVAVPIAAGGQEPAPDRREASKRRYCEARDDVASRLANRRRCYTKAEYDAMKHEARQVVDRIQMMKATTGR